MAEARRKVSDLMEAVDGLGPAPGGVTTMIDSANLRRQADHLQRADRLKSEAISAYAEYAGMLERALREIAEAQRQISSIARAKRSGAARAKIAGSKSRAGKPARGKKAARPRPSKKPARGKAARPKPAKKPARARKPARVRKAAPRRRR